MRKNKTKNKKSKRNYRNRGGSIMVPTEREERVNKDSGGDVAFSESVMKANEEKARKHAERMAKIFIKDMDPIPSEEAQEAMQRAIENEKMDELMEEAYENYKERKRTGKQEGGIAEEPIAMPEELRALSSEMEATEEEVPEDTYMNATPEEIELAQKPDKAMEDDYIVFILNESLAPEEQDYLMQTLEDDPQLSQIFDKVVETASEFSGSGEVTGPGNGISDSIPARLSDGEFVMTQKATEELGADNLQKMMDDAERAYDGGMMRKNRYLGGMMQDTEEELRLANENSTDDEIRKLMSLKANKTPSLR